MELDPDQMEAFVEQMSKVEASNSFASIRDGLWKTNGRTDTIKYYIDPKISKLESIHTALFVIFKLCIRALSTLLKFFYRCQYKKL